MMKKTGNRKTKAYVAYLNRMPVYETDIELVDYAMTTLPSWSGANPQRYPRLSGLTFDAAEKAKRVNHLKATVYDAVIKRLYELMMEYFVAVVEALIRDGRLAQKILGSEGVSHTEREILQAGSWDALCRKIAEDTVRALEQKRDTGKLITAINGRLNLALPRTIFDNAAVFIETRHLLVHNSGLADAKFRQHFGSRPGVKISGKGEIAVDFKFVKNAQKAMGTLVAEYDKALVSKNLVPVEFTQP